MSLTLFSLLNIKNLDWSSKHNAVIVCNVISIIFTILVCGLPIVFVVFIALKLKALADKEFQNKCGSLFEGSKLNMKQHQWTVVMIPATYYLRRLVMCLCLVFMPELVWGQVTIQMLTSTWIIIFVGWFRPLESNFANNMELFTEVVTMFTLYLNMCFTDFVGEPATRSALGWVCISIVSFFASVQILFLIADTCKQSRLYLHK